MSDGGREVVAQALQRCVSRVVDVPVGELREPGVADAGAFGDREPIASTSFEQNLDFGIECVFHQPRVAKFCLDYKQPIASTGRDSPRVNSKTTEKPINEVIAENLAHFMSERGMNQTALAKASGVAQTTISLYLDPARRLASKSGKAPSAKVGELALLATALGVESWQLMRPMTDKEREFYDQIESAFKSLTRRGKA